MRPFGNGSGPAPFGGADPTFLNHHAWSVRWQDRDRSIGMAQAVLDFSRAAGQTRAIGARRRNGLAMRTLAWQARWRGEFDRAESLAHRAIARLKGEGAESAIADALGTLAVVHLVRGRRDLARECIEDGFEVLASQPSVATRIDLLTTLAIVERFGRHFDKAQDAMQEALAIATGPEEARAEQSVARTLLYDEHPVEALEHAVRAIRLAREHRSEVILPYAMEVTAAAHIDLDEPDSAAGLLREALSLAREGADRRVVCHITYQRVRLARNRGEAVAALAIAQEGLEMSAKLAYPLLQIRFLDRIAELQEELGDSAAALRTLKQRIALREAERE